MIRDVLLLTLDFYDCDGNCLIDARMAMKMATLIHWRQYLIIALMYHAFVNLALLGIVVMQQRPHALPPIAITTVLLQGTPRQDARAHATPDTLVTNVMNVQPVMVEIKMQQSV